MKNIILHSIFFLFFVKGNAQTHKVIFKDTCVLKRFDISYAITNDSISIPSNYTKIIENEINVPNGKYLKLKNNGFQQSGNEITKGLSVLDYAIIADHILGVNPLPFEKQLASDVNDSGKISTADLVELRKIIIGTPNQLPLTNMWRMYSTDKAINSLNFSVKKDMILDFQVYKISDS